MIDGGRTIANVAGVEVCLYEAMRDIAAQFAGGGMTIETFIDALETLANTAAAKGGQHACT